ncbi:hypothetical protein ACJRO7_026918 [Eucalyptus globulus]|uniref:Uncharacterized protein n=1 Tax=Eucalyptus globulus TaxID=34317 RepID=A0ABD3JTD6_EUCGL
MIDFIAEAFGLPDLKPNFEPGKGLHHDRSGVNFAVAGATAFDPTFFNAQELGSLLWTNHTLNVQLIWFQGLKSSLHCDPYFKKSLFLVGEIGGNNYNFLFTLGASVVQLRFMVPLVVGAITNATSMLIEEGSVDLVVPGNFLIGCWTVYLALFHSSNESDSDPRTGCLKAYNEFSKYHNSYVKRQLQILRQKYRHARIMYADYYGAAIRFFCTPNHYGSTQAACCGGGGPYHFDLSAMCGSNGSTLCTDPSVLVNWDGIHSTEAVYQVIAKGWLHGPFTSPRLVASKSQWDNALASILLPKPNLCSWS